MSHQFIPAYDVKLRGGKLIIEWHYGAHPTIHAFPQSNGKRSNSFPPERRRRAKGTLWSDSNTRNIDKYPTPKPQKKRIADTNKNEFKLTETEDIALRKILKRSLQNVSKANINKITPNLKAADSNQTGRLPPAKVREILQRSQMILGEAGFVNLFKKFGGKIKDDVIVYYEQMIPFITKIWSEASELPKNKPSTPPAAGYFSYGSGRTTGKSYLGSNLNFGYVDSYNGSSGYSSYSDYGSYSPQPRRVQEMRNRVVFRDQDEAQLMVDLGRELSNMDVNMADLRRTMYDYDRDRNDFLNQDQVYATFERCGVYLSPDVYQRLLFAADRTGAGAYKIETLMNFMTRFKPEMNNHFIFGQDPIPTTSRIPILPALSNQPLFLTPWTQQPQDVQADPTFFLDPHLRDDQDELSEEEEKFVFDSALWRKDFLCLVEAIHHADHGLYGYMSEPEIRRLTETYDNVYNLGLSESTINVAIRRSSDAKYNEINIDKYTGLLQDLHIKEVNSITSGS